MAEKLSKGELKELQEEVFEVKPQPERELKKLTTDGRQYSLKFPKRFIEEAEIDVNKDVFEIVLELPDPKTDDKPKLYTTLLRK